MARLSFHFAAVLARSWRCSSAGQSRGIIILVSGVRIPAPPPMSGARSRPDRVSAHSARPYVKPRPNVLYRACRDALSGPCALARGSRVLVAVSGGPDSLALLHVLAELVRTQRFSLVVAHLDHGVRGARGAADARFVARRAR